MNKPMVRAAVTKLLTGIQGFDEITDGGLPRGRTTLVMGGPGCGKTVFALQIAGQRRAPKQGGRHVRRLRGEYGSNRRERRDVRLGPARAGQEEALLPRCAPLSRRRQGRRIRSDRHAQRPCRAKAKEIDAKCVVFDGIDVLLGICSTTRSRSGGRSIASATGLAKTGLTGIITQKVGGSEQDHRYGFLQFMVDCVIVLRHQVVDGSAFRNLRVMKYRGSGFSRRRVPDLADDATGCSSPTAARPSSSTR